MPPSSIAPIRRDSGNGHHRHRSPRLGCGHCPDEKYPNVRCAVGVHPNNCHEVPFERIADLRSYSHDARVVAIGEIGLDHHHKDASPELQAKYFEAQLGLAQELNFPVVIHSRESVDDCLAVLKHFPKVRAVFHCFTGTAADAARIWDAGHLTGFTGVVTFRNGRSLLEIAAQAPADRILVETDAPYLTPEPMRKQKINEPAMVIHTATAIAQARESQSRNSTPSPQKTPTIFIAGNPRKSGSALPLIPEN